MSLWGALPWENDDAADWLADLEDEPSLVAINEAIDDVLGAAHAGYVEVTEGTAGAAAAEVLAQSLEPPAEHQIVSSDALEQLRAMLLRLAPGARVSAIDRALNGLKAIVDVQRSEVAQLIGADKTLSDQWDSIMGQLIQRLQVIRSRLIATGDQSL